MPDGTLEHIIRWYGKYIEKHGDYEENIKMINLV